MSSLPPTAAIEPGHRIGRWTLMSPLGVGAFGQTWRVQGDDGRVAALKLVAEPPGTELRAMSRVCHPAVPRVLDHGRTAVGAHYIAMDLAPGQPLDTGLSRGAMDPTMVARLGACLLDALAAVHQAGVAHGDIKPENMLLDDMGAVPLSLIDFGLADGQGGTALWAAPEQLQGKGASPAADVYAAGLVLWAALEGHLPHADRPEAEQLALRCREVPPPTHGPEWLRTTIVRMLQNDPALRPTAGHAADAISAHGIRLPEVSQDLLKRRIHAAYVRRGAVGRATTGWRDRGGILGLIGPEGSGRTRELEQLALELAEVGRPALRVPTGSGDSAWDGIGLALRDLGQDLPVAPDETTRAHAIAEIIRSAGRPVLVDALEAQDPWTQRVVGILAESSVDLCVASAEGLDLEGRPALECALVPLAPAQCAEFLAQVLGSDADVPGLMAWLLPISGGHPATLGQALIRSLDLQALVRHNRTWVFDPGQAPTSLPDGSRLWLPEEGSPARRILELAALHPEPVTLGAIRAVWELDGPLRDAAVNELLEGRLVVHTGQGLGCTARVRGHVLTQIAAAQSHRIRERLFAYLLRLPDASPIAIVEHAVELPNLAQVHARGEQAIDLLRSTNPVRAVALAERLWAVAPEVTFATCRMRALIAAGRTSDARAVGEAASEQASGADSIPLMIEMASLAASNDGDAEQARTWVEQVRAVLGDADAPDRLELVDALSSDMLGDTERALAIATPLGAFPAPEGEGALETWLQARTVAAQSLHGLGRGEEGIALLTAVPPALGRGTGARASLSAALSRLLWFAGRYKDADAALASAAESDAGLTMLDRARLLNNLGALRHHSGNRPQAVAAWEQALVLFQRLGAEYEQLRAQSNLCAGYRELGQWEQARRAGEAALIAATRLGMGEVECHAALNLAELDMVHREFDQAERRIRRATETARRGEFDRLMVEARLRAVEVTTQRRQSTEALVAEAQDVHAQAESLGMRMESALAAALVALNLVRTSAQWTEIQEWIDTAVEPLQAAGASAELATVRTWVAETLLEAGRPQEAHAQVDRVRVFARESGMVPLRRRAEQISGRIGSLWTNPKQDARVSRLVKLAVEINEQSGLQSVLDRIADAGLALLEGDRAFVLMGEPPEVVAAASTSGDRSTPSMSVVRQSIEDDREVIAADVDERGDLRQQRSIVALELRSVLCVPMRHHGDIIGAIYVDSRSASQRHLWESAELMRGLAAMAAVAVVKARYFEASVEQARVAARLAERERVARELEEKNAQLEALNERLRSAVVTDPLTQLFNRRHLTECIQLAHDKARRSALTGGYGVIVCDIDHFKRINDTWGHPVGDRVLVEAAERMRDAVRSTDQVFRYGGEEMVVLAQATSSEELGSLGERLRAAMADIPIEMGAGARETITVSVGCAIYEPKQDGEWSSVVQRADVALYAAKSAGRNRVVVAMDDEADSAVA